MLTTLYFTTSRRFRTSQLRTPTPNTEQPPALNIQSVEVEGKTICRIHAPAEAAPHYLDNKLYVRLGNSTEELTGRDLEDWLRGRGEG